MRHLFFAVSLLLLSVTAHAADFDAKGEATRIAATISELNCQVDIIHQKLAALVSIIGVKKAVSASTQYDQAAGMAYYRFWDGSTVSRIDLSCTTYFKTE